MTRITHACGLLWLLLAATTGGAADTELHGHLKAEAGIERYPADSLFADIFGGQSADQAANARLNLRVRSEGWAAAADYQLAALAGDRYRLHDTLPDAGLSPRRLPDDDRRLFDLTRVLREGDDAALLHRLDRLSLGYSRGPWVVRAGRQAISWGNGLLFTPMDFFNPFDPAAVDREYKNGDDMLYGQYLRDNGHDLQAVWVARRDDAHRVTQAVASQAVKYRGTSAVAEFDLLAARHYDETLLGVGFARPLGALLWTTDVTAVDASDAGWTGSLVSGLTFSAQHRGKNLTGRVEYFFNGLGVSADEYDALAEHPDLLKRLTRAELYTLGRHYLGASLGIEITPLLQVSPNLFINLGDRSLLAQLVMTWNPSQSAVLTGALNLPVGPDNTEYGGPVLAPGLKPASTEAGVFVQIAWYL